jgi:uncharacterized protein (DUF2132 family)
MNDSINYKNNPLHGVGLKSMLTEIVDHYGFGILYAYLKINCFKTNPSIHSSVKFLKKTDWAREKVESFYLYEYKNLPRATADQFELPPRDRRVPDGQVPGEPAKLSLEDAERLHEKRAKKATAKGQNAQHQSTAGKNVWSKRNNGHSGKHDNDHAQNDSYKSTASSSESSSNYPDPWANWKKRN